MTAFSTLDKVRPLTEMASKLSEERQAGHKVVFTNGCFDLLHPGHLRYLFRARQLGDRLVVAVNSDRSVRELKGPTRPIIPESERAEVLAALAFVDFVTIFDDPTPARVVRMLRPSVLVKGGDWAPDQIVGRDTVEADGGRVLALPFEDGFSTTNIIERVLSSVS